MKKIIINVLLLTIAIMASAGSKQATDSSLLDKSEALKRNGSAFHLPSVEPSASPVLVPPLVKLFAKRPFLQEGRNTIFIQMSNHFNESINAEISLENMTTLDLQLDPQSKVLKVPPSATRGFVGKAISTTKKDIVKWPSGWVIFPDVVEFPVGEKGIPRTLKGFDGKAVNGFGIKSVTNKVNIEKAGFKCKESRSAFAFAIIDAPSKCQVCFGASADWWMRWFLNGKEVYSTLESGNGGSQSVDAHMITLNLKEGINDLAIQVLSGSQGWSFMTGSPVEMQRRIDKQPVGDFIKVSLRSDKLNVVEYAPIEVIPFIEELAFPVENTYAFWMAVPPTDYPNNIYNMDEKRSDSKLWWQGEEDLSVTVWVRMDEYNLHFAVMVKDSEKIDLPAKVSDKVRLITIIDEKFKKYDMKSVSNNKSSAFYLQSIPKPVSSGVVFSLLVFDTDKIGPKQNIKWKRRFALPKER